MQGATFGQRLQAAREAAGLTRNALAVAANLSDTTISRLERGEVEPLLATVRTLARVLGVGLLELAGPDPEPGEPAEQPPRGRPRKSENSATNEA